MMSDPYTAVNLQPDWLDRKFHKSIGLVSHAIGNFHCYSSKKNGAKVEVKKIPKISISTRIPLKI